MRKTLTFILAVFALALAGCDDEKVPDINILSTFDDTRFTGSFTFDGNSVPLTGGFVHLTKNGTFNEIVVSLAPAGSEGSVAFPGTGWVQFRFNADVKPGFLYPQEQSHLFTAAGPEKLSEHSMHSVYVDGENNYWQFDAGGEVVSNELNYKNADEYDFSFSFRSSSSLTRDLGDGSISTPKAGQINFSVSTSAPVDAGNGTGGIDCSGGYDGPEFDIQIDSQCQAAFAYACAGAQEGVDAACAIYKAWQKDDSSIPDCPYCK